MPPFPPIMRSFRGWSGSSRWSRDFTFSRAPWSLRLGCHQVLESTMNGHPCLPHLCMDLGHPPPHPEFLAAMLMEHWLHGSHHRVDKHRLRHKSITQSQSFLL
ncbi:hypothetical protein XELAEV_18045112mg [Xenopus laevis]|uniref:Uncharacterized protein n=1 Tax=Xenopus laevis TaxID=8355 RepID=A0A974C030_XENLA|nr:hypothetical protein XELAEV_18045112mg [Xenopus laevis]